MKNELLGDAITHVPAYRALRHALPDHRIVALYRKSTAWANTLARARSEFLDEVRTDQPIADGPRMLSRTLNEIENLRVVLDFRVNMHSWWSYLATARMPVTYVANVAGFMLRHNIPLGFETRPATNVWCTHRVVELAVGRSLPFDYHLTPPSAAVASAAQLVPEGSDFVLLACGNPHSNKSWPRDGWIGLARHVAAMGVTPVFLLGVQESGERDWIRQQIPQAIIVDSTAAEQTEQLPWLFVALAQRARAAVTVEGGIGHLIATSGLPILTIAGPTDPIRWRPVTPHHFTAWAKEFGSRKTSDVPLAIVIARTEAMLRMANRAVRAAGDQFDVRAE